MQIGVRNETQCQSENLMHLCFSEHCLHTKLLGERGGDKFWLFPKGSRAWKIRAWRCAIAAEAGDVSLHRLGHDPFTELLELIPNVGGLGGCGCVGGWLGGVRGGGSGCSPQSPTELHPSTPYKIHAEGVHENLLARTVSSWVVSLLEC